MKGETPRRAFRIPDPLWEKVKAIADKRGETITDMVIRVLEQITADEVSPLPEPPTFVIHGTDELTAPMKRWCVQLNEYVQAVAVAMERMVKRP